MNPEVDWRDRRIALLGAGREGQAAYAWFLARMPELRLTVIAETPIAAEFSRQIRPCDRVFVEPLSVTRLCSFDILIRSPGISPYRQALQGARQAGVEITSASNLWFATHRTAKTICITGTKGKSTTSALIAHLLSACGYSIRLAGNIGVPLIACDDVAVDWWVIELSSYQLTDLQARPDIGVILNLSPEHLDWHDGEANYMRDKLRLAGLVSQEKLILNAADEELGKRFSGLGGFRWFNVRPGIHAADGQLLLGETPLRVNMPAGLPGKHNLSNTAAALTATTLAGCDLAMAVAAVSTFKSLPHRLQILGESEGRLCVNDSIATTPVATVAALEAMTGKNIILVVGGLDRGLDWTRHGPAIRDASPKAVIGIPDSGHRVLAELAGTGLAPANGLHEAADLRHAITLAKALSAPGDLILLSPGAPSFPHFMDFRDRGKIFAKLCGLEAEPG